MVATSAAASTLTGAAQVIVALIGGTMLTLALTRPQLRWLRSATAGHRSRRLWAERAITGFSFVMGGYAAMSVLLVLYGQLGRDADALLEGAAYFLIVYAGLVHYEPFVCEWRVGSGMRAFALYIALVLPAIAVGAAIAIFMLSALSVRSGIAILTICGMGGVTWIMLYTLSVRIKVTWRRPNPPRGEFRKPVKSTP